MSGFFKDKIVIITGASLGIGAAAARRLHREGARLVLAARGKDRLEALARELDGTLAVPTDVTKTHDVENLIQKTLAAFGRIDILVNNAGILVYKPLEETSPEEIRALMETNYFGAVNCANAVVKVMKEQKSGAIANVASIAGKVGFTNLGYYCASKFALMAYSHTLRQEVAPCGINVTAICPGTVETPMTQAILRKARAKGKHVLPIQPEEVADAILYGIREGKREVFVPRLTWFLYVLHFFFPGFVEWLAFYFRASDAPVKQK